MRIRSLALLLPLAFMLASAAPSNDARDKARRAVYEAQALALCQIGMAQHRLGDFESGDASQGCGCTVDALMTGKTVAQLPRLSSANFPTVVKDELALCLDRMAKIGVKRQVGGAAGPQTVPIPEPPTASGPSTVSAPPTVSEPPTLSEPVPGAGPVPPGARAPAEPIVGESSSAWDEAIAWLSSVPLWALGLAGLIILLAAARKLARRDDRHDLSGVPRSMRSSVGVPPSRPDFPPKG